MSKRATRSSGETLVTPTDDDTSVKKKRKKKKSTKSMSQFHDTDKDFTPGNATAFPSTTASSTSKRT